MNLKKTLPQIKEILKMMSVEIHPVDEDTVDFKFNLMPVTDSGRKCIALIPATITVYSGQRSYLTLLAHIKLPPIDNNKFSEILKVMNDFVVYNDIVGNLSIKDSDMLYFNNQFLCEGGLSDEDVCHGIMLSAITCLTSFIQEIMNRIDFVIETLPFIYRIENTSNPDNEPSV